MRTDQYQGHDYYLMDELLSDEHKLVRDSARAWVKKEMSPIIEEYYEKATFPRHVIPGMAEIGAFGPYIPEEYGARDWIRFPTVSSCRNSKDAIAVCGPHPLFKAHW